MPTSSQSNILDCNGFYYMPDNSPESYKSKQSSTHILQKKIKTEGSVPVVRLYNIWNKESAAEDEEDFQAFLGQDQAISMMQNDALYGKISVISYDEELNAKKLEESLPHTKQIELPPVSKLAPDLEQYADPVKSLYNRLSDIGFRKCTLHDKDDHMMTWRKDLPDRRRFSLPALNKAPFSCPAIQNAWYRRSSFTTKPWRNEMFIGLSNTSSDSDVTDGEPFFQAPVLVREIVEEGCTRIMPGTHMRDDTPETRPTTAIFSLRDNENSSHGEVKYLIETQLGVRVKSIQFDPLNIRVCKPNIRSRWITEFHSVKDLETAVKKGLVIGTDRIIIYKFDYLTKREISAFKYFKTINDAKKKILKGSKTYRNRTKIHSDRSTPVTMVNC